MFVTFVLKHIKKVNEHFVKNSLIDFLALLFILNTAVCTYICA